VDENPPAHSFCRICHRVTECTDVWQPAAGGASVRASRGPREFNGARVCDPQQRGSSRGCGKRHGICVVGCSGDLVGIGLHEEGNGYKIRILLRVTDPRSEIFHRVPVRSTWKLRFFHIVFPGRAELLMPFDGARVCDPQQRGMSRGCGKRHGICVVGCPGDRVGVGLHEKGNGYKIRILLRVTDPRSGGRGPDGCADDPDELKNHASEHPEVCAELSVLARKYAAQFG